MPELAIDQLLLAPEEFAGHTTLVPVLDGGQVRPINLDHAASTPALARVRNTAVRFLEWYSSVHRGTGFRSQLSTHAFEEAREVVGRFVGARPGQHIVAFGPNSTWALNKLARRIRFQPGDVVVSTALEHHANDLPWRQVAHVIYTRVDASGALDEAHFAALLRRYAGRVRLVAVSGGSNVTGHLPPIHRLAEQAHTAGAEIAVDAAQLAPHRRIDIGELDDPQHLDYVAFSGHKVYAPFGSGVLVGRRDTFQTGVPEQVGGGTVRQVTHDSVSWADAPAREEAGTPNVVGAVALAAAAQELERIGFDAIAEHEAELTGATLAALGQVPGLRIYGDADPSRAAGRLGVVPFALDGIDHRLVAAILSYEYGIAVRSGAFCAQPYVRHLLDAGAAELACDAQRAGGLVRISFGLGNTLRDVDALALALNTIARREYRGQYVIDPDDGSYVPRGWSPSLNDYWSL